MENDEKKEIYQILADINNYFVDTLLPNSDEYTSADGVKIDLEHGAESYFAPIYEQIKKYNILKSTIPQKIIKMMNEEGIKKNSKKFNCAEFSEFSSIFNDYRWLEVMHLRFIGTNIRKPEFLKLLDKFILDCHKI